MVSDASPSPGTADPKMNESLFIQRIRLLTMHAHRMSTSNVPIRPLLTEICGWFLGGFWVVFGWFWGCGTSDTRLARRKLGKNIKPQPWRPPLPYDLHGAPPRRRRIRQSSNMLRDKSMSLKLKNICVITIY